MTTGEFILCIIGITLVIYLLGKYALEQGQRIESRKEFFKNMNEHDKKLKKLKNGSRN